VGADGVAIVQHRRAWVPRNERIAVDVDAVVHRSDDSKVAVHLINMSFEGCGLAALYPFEVGERVRIAIVGQGYIEAEMRWSCEERAGAVFFANAVSERPADDVRFRPLRTLKA